MTWLSAGLVWALVAASAGFWGTRMLSTRTAAAENIAAPSTPMPGPGAFSRLMGQEEEASPAAPEPAAAASRFRLNGVVAPTVEDDSGIALIAVDGHRPRAFRIGDVVDAGFRLEKVSHRSATLVADDPTATVVLEVGSPDAVQALAMPSPSTSSQMLPGAMPIGAGPAPPVSTAVRPETSSGAASPPPDPAIDLAQEPSARPPGSAPGAMSPGRRKRLRGLAH